jgi:2-methylcitrate dehydratase PrpD
MPAKEHAIVAATTRRTFLGGTVAAAATTALSPIVAFAQPGHGSSQAAPTVALELARFLLATRFEDLPRVAVEHAKIVVASTLASAAPGSRIESAAIIRELAKEQGGRADASIWYDGARLPIAQAARVNAMQSDASASDDSDLRNVAHSGTTVAAIGLAIGERSRASGRDLVAAIVTGYEAAGRISEALMAQQGFHASMAVAFGGTVTAGRLLGLTAEQMADALSLTATTVGGLAIGTNSWAREYHAGNAVVTAINAALAAGRGFTANPDMLEARRGFIATFAGSDVDPSSLVHDLGSEWDIVTHLAIKLVPGAHAFHPAVEAAVEAARRADVGPEQIARILVSGPRHRSLPVEQPPADLIEAIHSLPYFLASAVADRDFSWVHATPEKIASAPMAALIGRVGIDPAPPAIDYAWGWGATVTIVTTSGERYTSTVDAPRASGPRGIEWRDIDAKYFALMPESGLSTGRTRSALGIIHRLEESRDVTELTALLAPA